LSFFFLHQPSNPGTQYVSLLTSAPTKLFKPQTSNSSNPKLLKPQTLQTSNLKPQTSNSSNPKLYSQNLSLINYLGVNFAIRFYCCVKFQHEGGLTLYYENIHKIYGQ